MSIDIALYRSHFWETVSQQTSFYSDSYNLSPSFPLYFSSLTPTGKAYFSLLHTLQSWLWLDSSTIWSIRTGRPLEKVATCQFCIRDPGIADPSVERMCPWQSLPLGPGPSLRTMEHTWLWTCCRTTQTDHEKQSWTCQTTLVSKKAMLNIWR